MVPIVNILQKGDPLLILRKMLVSNEHITLQ